MLAWKIAPALAMGNTVVLKPAEFTSLTALRFAELCRGDRPAAGRGEHHHRRRPHRRGARRRIPDVDKIAFTGSTEVGPHHPHGHRRAAARSSRSSWAASRRSSSSTTPTSTAWSRAWWTRSGSTRARSAAPARGSWCRRASPSGWSPSSRRGWRRSGSAIRSTRRWTWARSSRRSSSRRSRSWCAGARRRAPRCGSRRGAARTEGWFFPPTLFTEVSPAATIAQVEIFGPVVVLMTFRTPAEAVELANNTRYGLAASVWTENINLALDVAPAAQGRHGLDQLHQRVRRGERLRRLPRERVRARGRAGGAVGVREVGGRSGDGRTGGRAAGTAPKTRARRESARAASAADARAVRPPTAVFPPSTAPRSSTSAASRRGPTRATACRCSMPTGGGSARWGTATGRTSGTRSRRRTRRPGWARATAHNRAQVLYYLAENLAARADEFGRRLAAARRRRGRGRRARWRSSIERIYTYAAWADKYDGLVHHTPYPERHARHARADRRARRGLPGRRRRCSASSRPCCRPIAMGNTVVAVPSGALRRSPRPTSTRCSTPPMCRAAWSTSSPACATSWRRCSPRTTTWMAIWYFGTRRGVGRGRAASAGNMKRTWVDYGQGRDWTDPRRGRGRGVPGAGDPGQEHLGAVRGVSELPTERGSGARPLRRALAHDLHVPLRAAWPARPAFREAPQHSSPRSAPASRGAIRTISASRVSSVVTVSTAAVWPRSSPSATRSRPLSRRTIA